MELEKVLGPRWSLKELRTFYILLKAHGQQWDKLEERLPQRSGAMVRALFAMHRSYLSLSQASVEGFCAIMMDHYEMQDKQKTRTANQIDDDVAMDVVKHEESAPRSRKKRRLEKFLATDQLMTTLRVQTESREQEMEKAPKKLKRKRVVPMRSRAWLPREQDNDDDTGLAKVHGARFDLPWSHWFYSYVDVAFFSHNEFIECLSSMGLGTIKTAARPIWSSVRASMGRPRRLSPLFFTQEKEKLEAYRRVKRQLDPMQLPADRTWPYQCAAPLQPGMSVIAWMESERRFRLGTVTTSCTTGKACEVSLCGTNPRVTMCSLDNVMVLNFPPWSIRSKSSSVEPKLAAATLLRRDNGIRGSAPTLSPPRESATICDQYHEDKIRAVLAVKRLLHRKEKIISSIALLNAHAAEQQVRLREKNAVKSSMWTTPTAFSSAAVKGPTWTNSRERLQFQKQHSWLVANLDATNKCLRDALLVLQSFSVTDTSEANHSNTSLADPSDATKWNRMMPTETLTEGQMRWAIDFLAASRQKAATVVAESASHIVRDTEPSTLNSSADEAHLGNVMPETMQLVINCITLTSVLHRHVAASPDVPPVITQKLLERVLELLKPSHEANMDLYAELHAAVDAAQAQVVLEASTNEAD